MQASLKQADHWTEVARRWAMVGPPLRPTAQDLGFVVETIRRQSEEQNNRALRAVILGVTPELYRLPWPPGTDLIAVDHTQAMIDAVWPGDRTQVICGDWVNIPLGTGSRDLALCDGGLHLMRHPQDQAQFVRGLRGVLEPGGRLVVRLFSCPDRQESVAAVMADLMDGRIPNLNILKLRLGMALQRDATEGVRLGEVWAALQQVAPDLVELAERLGWRVDHTLSINTYRDCDKRYHFLTTQDALSLFCRQPGGFVHEMTNQPTYALGERCPTVVFRVS
jgi:SAM-dependent methyltransferase